MLIHALKVEDFPSIPMRSFDAIANALREFTNEALDVHDREVEAIECRSRDGFIPYSHNKGGFQKVAFTSLGTMQGTGYATGSDKFNQIVEELIKNNREYFDRSEFDSDDAFEDAIHESLYDNDYNSVMVKVQVLYNGYANGKHEVDVSVMLEATDAPYHRGYDDLLEKSIRFTTVKELRSKLKALLPKVSDFIGSIAIELY